MSGDPVQDMVDTLAATRRDVADVRKLIDAKAPGPDVVRGVQAELAQLKTAVQSVNPQRVLDAATSGAKAAAGEIGQATAALREAVARIEAGQGAGWKLKTALVLLVLVLGLLGGSILSVRLLPTAFLATETGCNIAGGRYVTPTATNAAKGCWISGQ
jgi:hypothetical protein